MSDSRDLFAAHAMSALIAADPSADPDDIADQAWKLAGAMAIAAEYEDEVCHTCEHEWWRHKVLADEVLYCRGTAGHEECEPCSAAACERRREARQTERSVMGRDGKWVKQVRDAAGQWVDTPRGAAS